MAPSHNPAHLSKHFQNVITFRLRERAIGRRLPGLHEALGFAGWRAQDWPGGQDYRPLDKILQFPDIARPIVSPDDLRELIGNHVDYFVHPPGKPSYEMPDKLRDIFGVLPQRR